MPDFARQVEQLRPQLLRFARSQLRNDAWAEDAVSETLLAALVDDLLFDAGGAWREPPQDWGDDPEAALGQRQFFEVLEACVEHLPAAQGRAFLMREWLGLDTEEICKELAISSTNLWVLLHRARLRLRECLQAGWIDSQRARA
jgi:DNA-directed RNA polymerase specialized sigma24 family protein